MKLRINPTRMALLKLKKRVAFARRGHKLLKDKEEQLLIEFRKLVTEIRDNRNRFRNDLADYYTRVLSFRGISGRESWRQGVNCIAPETGVSSDVTSVFNIPVRVTRFSFGDEKPSFPHGISPALFDLVTRGKNILTNLAEIATLENKLYSFSAEIERTRRRVNALEHVLIPNLEETIAFISFKIDETERSSIVRLKHIRLIQGK